MTFTLESGLYRSDLIPACLQILSDNHKRGCSMVGSKFSTYLIARADRRLTGSWKEEKTEQRNNWGKRQKIMLF